MKLKELRQIHSFISDLWDFFITNSDGDETGLVQEVEKEYVKTKKIIRDEFFKLHLRNSMQREKSKFNKNKN